MEDPAARATRTVTRVASGAMVWRAWGAGPPLVLLHGASGSWTHWIRNVPELSRHYELWAADIPGLGDSAMPPCAWRERPVTSAPGRPNSCSMLRATSTFSN